MEHLFRLVLTRPAIAQDESTPSVRLAQDSDFQAALGQAQQQERKAGARDASFARLLQKQEASVVPRVVKVAHRPG